MTRKPIFDTVRKLLGRGLTPSETAQIDLAIDRSMGGASDDTSHSAIRKVGPEGLALIKSFEGCARKRHDGRFEAYPDPGTGGEPWTIGWGATHMRGRKVRCGDIISQTDADSLLEEHLESYAAEVADALKGAPTTQAQFDALVSFHYNTGAIANATVTKKHRAGDYEGAAQELLRWTRAGGRVMKGLVRRREAEAELYRKGCLPPDLEPCVSDAAMADQ